MRTVILGGGFGGVYTANCLLSCAFFSRRRDIVLISRNPYFEFKPLFMEVLGGRLTPESARFRLEDIFGKSPCKLKLASISAIDPERRTIKTDKGDVRFDYLVIALGGRPEPVPSIRSAAASLFPVESLGDCTRLRDHIDRLARGTKKPSRTAGRAPGTIAVIGAGPTGVEAAAEISHFLTGAAETGKGRGKRSSRNVVLIDAAKQILPGWGASLREKAEMALEKFGVSIITEAPVTRISKGRIFLGSGKSLRADDIVWSGGYRGLPLYETVGAPLDRKGRLKVDPFLRLSGSDRIYAMGDAINTDVFQGHVPQSAQAAFQQAKVIAHNITSDMNGRPLQRLSYSELGQAMPMGGRKAVAHILGVPFQGHLAWLLEKILFTARVPGWRNKLKMLNDLALDPLAEKGEAYLAERGW